MNSVQHTANNVGFKIYLISMIRNEADIIKPFLRQATNLFDKVMLVDVQSTDSTESIINIAAMKDSKICIYKANRQEKYQSIMMNLLSRKAFEEGACWVFFLDADEFININNRQSFEDYVKSFNSDLMYLPWLNLVPSQYGDFNNFDISQTYYWSGRPSIHNKIAMSAAYFENNRDYYIHEGNHLISNVYGASPSTAKIGLSILHLPIRSIDRFKYKTYAAMSTMKSKHILLPGEGSHVSEMYKLIENHGINNLHLNYIAANYGESLSKIVETDPGKIKWPTKRMPSHIISAEDNSEPMSLDDVMLADSKITWDKESFINGTPIRAGLSGDCIQIQPQPICGNGRIFTNKYQELELNNPKIPKKYQVHNLKDAISASFTDIRTLRFSAWSPLIPALFCLFSFLQPRRYVELGSHNGTSFFAACQASEVLDTNTQCVAIDGWLGDEHASFYSPEVFSNFTKYLSNTYPQQHYIRSYFHQALPCFENGSIDLLHIDGLHTYDAVKSDFETWLPKMSGCGVIILHDTEVFERNFGVWKLLDELKRQYPSFSVPHSYGLAIVYVGKEPSPISDCLKYLSENREVSEVVKVYLEAIGNLSVKYKNVTDQLAADEASGSNLFSLKLWRTIFSLRAVKYFRVLGRRAWHHYKAYGFKSVARKAWHYYKAYGFKSFIRKVLQQIRIVN